MGRKLEKVNKSFNSFKPLLSKVLLRKLGKIAQLKLIVPISKNR